MALIDASTIPDSLFLNAPSPEVSAASVIAGQDGSPFDPADFADAVEIVPIGSTENMVLERQPRVRQQRKPPVRQAGTPWGGAAVSIPGGCDSLAAKVGLPPAAAPGSPWAALFILIGLGIIAGAVVKSK